MRYGGILGFVVGAGVVFSCSGAPREVAAPPPPPSAPPSAAPAPDPPEPPPPPEPAASAEPAPSASAAPAAPPVPSVAEVCEALCVHADQVCSKENARRCRGVCAKYVKGATGCEDQVRAALECQMQADTSDLCAQIASSTCAREFRAMQACQRGEAPPEAPAATDQPPEGWQKVADEILGFSVALPPGAALDPSAARRTWRAEAGGVTYLVVEIPAPAKVTDAALLRMAVDYVGFRCQRNLKLHGRFDADGITGVRYDSACGDQSEWHGMLRIRGGKALSIGLHAPAGTPGVLDPYFFSFEYQKP